MRTRVTEKTQLSLLFQLPVIYKYLSNDTLLCHWHSRVGKFFPWSGKNHGNFRIFPDRKKGGQKK